jgi:hypothetical protein
VKQTASRAANGQPVSLRLELCVALATPGTGQIVQTAGQIGRTTSSAGSTFINGKLFERPGEMAQEAAARGWPALSSTRCSVLDTCAGMPLSCQPPVDDGLAGGVGGDQCLDDVTGCLFGGHAGHGVADGDAGFTDPPDANQDDKPLCSPEQRPELVQL